MDGQWVDSDGLQLRVFTAGPDDGTCVLLMHGWPDSAELWRHQMPVLADLGYRVIAFDQRGFGESDVPVAVEDSHLFRAVGDVLAILDHFEIGAAHLVGHDWGAAVGWLTASFHSDRVLSLTALAVGHPNAFRSAGLEQMRRSFYMLLFQYEGVAEEWLRSDDWRVLRDLFGAGSEAAHQIERLSREGRLTASLNWYRANINPATWVGEPPELPSVTVPCHGVIGARDAALGIEQMEGSAAYVDGSFDVTILPAAGHWLTSDDPEGVSEILAGWLGGFDS